MKLRPMSPHLTIYKAQLSSTLSIFHRISGVLLSLSIFFVSTSLFISSILPYLSFSFYCHSTLIQLFFFYLFVYIIVPFFIILIVYHIFNGFRHLLWDFGFFLDIKSVYTTGKIVVALTTIVSLFILSIL